MKKALKTILFTFTCLTAGLALASCGGKNEDSSSSKVDTHVHQYTWEKDATKHRQVCACEVESYWEAHVWGEWEKIKDPTLDEKGSHKRTCSVCGYVATEDIPALTPTLGETTEDWTAIYTQVPADWEAVNIYYWGDNLSTDYAVGWPGAEMTLVNADSHIYGYQLPKGVANVIFNNGSAQTTDVSYSPDRNLYVLDAANAEGKFEIQYKSYTANENDPELAKPSKNEPITYVTIYAQVPESWTTVNLHFWGAPVGNSDWPGAAMTKVENTTNLWSVSTVPSGATAFIVNNKVGDEGVQTANQQLPEGANTFIIAEDLTVTYAKYENGTFTPVEASKEIVLYVKGTMNSWSNDDAYKLNVTDNTATITLELEADAESKVADAVWSLNFGYVDTLDATCFADNSGNIKVLVKGTYTITITNLDTTPVLTITPATV